MSKDKTQSTLDAMLAQYEAQTKTYDKTDAKVYDLKNYFTTHMADKVKTATKKIRIIPIGNGVSPFVVFHGHKAQIDGDWKTYACLKHENDQDCPFCEAYDALRATGKESDKELAKKYNAKKMYILKVIDRDNEEDGIKFWRFSQDWRGTGVYDKIFGILQATKSDIADPVTGRDLMVILARDQNNRPIIQSITHLDPSPLSDDAEKAAEWLADEKTWRDVYAERDYPYLEIVVKGGIPTWDKEAKKFVDKNSIVATADATANLDEELSLGVANVKTTVTAAAAATPTAAPAAVAVTSEEEEDDLPF